MPNIKAEEVKRGDLFAYFTTSSRDLYLILDTKTVLFDHNNHPLQLHITTAAFYRTGEIVVANEFMYAGEDVLIRVTKVNDDSEI